MDEAKEWIIQRCTQMWVGTELQYEDFPAGQPLLTRTEMSDELDRVGSKNPDGEFRGHRVIIDGTPRTDGCESCRLGTHLWHSEQGGPR